MYSFMRVAGAPGQSTEKRFWLWPFTCEPRPRVKRRGAAWSRSPGRPAMTPRRASGRCRQPPEGEHPSRLARRSRTTARSSCRRRIPGLAELGTRGSHATGPAFRWAGSPAGHRPRPSLSPSVPRPVHHSLSGARLVPPMRAGGALRIGWNPCGTRTYGRRKRIFNPFYRTHNPLVHG